MNVNHGLRNGQTWLPREQTPVMGKALLGKEFGESQPGKLLGMAGDSVHFSGKKQIITSDSESSEVSPHSETEPSPPSTDSDAQAMAEPAKGISNPPERHPDMADTAQSPEFKRLRLPQKRQGTQPTLLEEPPRQTRRKETSVQSASSPTRSVEAESSPRSEAGFASSESLWPESYSVTDESQSDEERPVGRNKQSEASRKPANRAEIFSPPYRNKMPYALRSRLENGPENLESKSPYNLRKRPPVAPKPPDSYYSSSEEETTLTTPPPRVRIPQNALGQLLAQLMVPVALKLRASDLGSEPMDEDAASEDGDYLKKFEFEDCQALPADQPRGFARLAGMDETKQDLKRLFLNRLRYPDLYQTFNLGSAATAVLLYGPPGCGKTYFAKALAEEAGANFVAVPISSVASRYVHETPKLIGELFEQAAHKAAETKRPTIILLDEIEALAPDRGDDESHNKEEVAEFLNQLNTSGAKNVFVVAATNHPDQVDRALLREGRMNLKVFVGAPDHNTRKQILKMHLEPLPHGALDFDALAKRTEHYSNSGLVELVRNAATRSVDRNIQAQESGTAGPALFPVLPEDMEAAMKAIKPSLSADVVQEYKRKAGQFEDGGAALANQYLHTMYT